MSESGPTSVVIVGGGLAGAKTAEALREQGYAGPVTLLAAEDELPYERPPLSKGYLSGKDEFDGAVVHPQEWYDEHDVDLRLGTTVTAIHRDRHEVELDGGGTVPYGALVLATGSEPRTLPLEGVGTPLTLRTHADSDRIRAHFGPGKRLAVVGAGWIGLEVAAAARDAGTDVTVVEAADQPLLAVLGADMGAVFADLHREHGVDLRLSSSDLSVLADLGADAVVVGIGVRPRTELADAAGLDVDNGVLVDRALRTSDPDVYAVGDIANHDHPTLGHRVRVEHWANALHQPATAVAALLGDADAAYDRLPYFFSDQYDLGMEYVGHVPRDAEARVVIRGDLEGREFVAFWLDGSDRILAAMNVNVWDVVDEVRPLIAAGTPVDLARLADPDVAYDQVTRPQA